MCMYTNSHYSRFDVYTFRDVCKQYMISGQTRRQYTILEKMLYTIIEKERDLLIIALVCY